MNDYYDTEIEKFRNQNIVNIRILYSISSALVHKNKGVNEHLSKLIKDLTDAEQEKKDHYYKKIMRFLDKIKDQCKLNDTILETKFENDLIGKNRLNYLDAIDIRSGIKREPIYSFKKYAGEYVSSCRMIESMKKQKENASQRKTTNTYTNVNPDEIVSSVQYGYSSYQTTNALSSNEPYYAKTSEETKNLIYADLESKKTSNIQDTFNSDEQAKISKVFPDMTQTQLNLLNDGIEQNVMINNINQNKTVNTKLMMDFGQKVLSNMKKALLVDTASLTNRTGILNGINEYKKAYKKYYEAYSKMNASEKSQEDNHVINNRDYINTFWPNNQNYAKIVDPEQLRKTINAHIMHDALKNGVKYFYSDSIDLTRITSLMDVQELVTLYKRSSEELSVYNKNNPNFNKDLQVLFATLISRKLKNTTMKKEDEPNKISMEQYKLEQAAIIKNIINEQPFDAELSYYANMYNSKDVSDKLVLDHNVRKNAQEKIYNMGGFKKSVAKITGKWNTYMKIMEQEKFTREDIETLGRM